MRSITLKTRCLTRVKLFFQNFFKKYLVHKTEINMFCSMSPLHWFIPTARNGSAAQISPFRTVTLLELISYCGPKTTFLLSEKVS